MVIPDLFDEHGSPDFRARFRRELRRARRVEIAVKRIRLATIDLTPEELRCVQELHLILSELRAPALDGEAHVLMARPAARARMRCFHDLLTEGRLRIRVAPLGGWSPDFTVFSNARGPQGVLVGVHQFERPHPYPGPALGMHFGRSEAILAHRRFQEIWRRGHDVAEAVDSIFRRAARWSNAPKSVDTIPALG